MEEEEENSSENMKLFDAVEKGDEEVVKVLLQSQKVNVNFKFKEKVLKNLFFFFLLFFFFFGIEWVVM